MKLIIGAILALTPLVSPLPPNLPLDAPTRFVVYFDGWNPETCEYPVPLDAYQPVGLIVTGTTTVYQREFLAACEITELGAAGVFTAPLPGIELGEPINYRVKGQLSHLAVAGTGIAGEEITPPILPAGDLDGDNVVTISDWGVMQPVYGMSEEDAEIAGLFVPWYYSNINRDLVVDVLDFDLLLPIGRAGAP